MHRSTRIVIWCVVIFLAAGFFLALLPSLIGFLLITLLVFVTVDYAARRHRNAVKTFNSAVRAVSNHEGAIAKVALAFSRSGPLSGPCYEYSRRLMMGENPIDAAVMVRVPLQLQTAIALQSPGESPGAAAQRHREESEIRELAMIDTTMMPVYGQFLYLTFVAMVTCMVLGFMAMFVVPTLEQMFREFFAGPLPFRWMFSTLPAICILILIALVGIILIPVLNRGQLLGIRLPRWMPMFPRLAERKADILNGLADGIDAGWPIGRSLAVGHSICTRRLERGWLDRAMRLIERGIDPIAAIHRSGWIDGQDAAWLHDSSPQRKAELLRTIADQGIRDARSNIRWLMAIFFPALVLMLGLAVLAFAFGFMSTMMELVVGLA